MGGSYFLRRLEMTPTLSSTLGESGTWIEIIEKSMQFPKATRSEIVGTWEEYLEIAKMEGKSVLPEEFAEELFEAQF